MCKKITNYKNTRNYKNWLVYSFQSFTKINSPQMSELRRWDSQCDLLTCYIYFWIASSEYDIKWSCSDGDLYLTGSLLQCPLYHCLHCAVQSWPCWQLYLQPRHWSLAPIMQVSLLLSNINHMDQATHSIQALMWSLLWIYILFWTVFFCKIFHAVFFIFFPLKMPRHHSQARRKEVKYNCNQCDYQATRRVGLTH